MKTTLFITAAMLGISLTAGAQQSNAPVEDGRSEKRAGNFEKANVVKLYSRKEKGTVIITSRRPFDVQLYIFDLDGTMMHQTVLKSKTRTRISSLAKGTYTYTIFANDESVEEGKLIIQ